MPFIVQHLLEGQGELICVRKEEKVSRALSLMIEHDFSQLPVVDVEDRPEGLVTHEGILRGIRNFKLGLDELRVRDVMGSVDIYGVEDNLFDMLDRLKLTNAVLIVDPGYFLAGIVTSYDATEYFRSRAENLMRVEDIELMIKEFIRSVFTNYREETNEARLNETVAKVVFQDKNLLARPKTFNDLTLGEYLNLLGYKEVWQLLEPIFGISKKALLDLLHSVRETRNALAHFRNDITSEQEEQLKFCVDWLARVQAEYQKAQEEAFIAKILSEHEEKSPEKIEVKPQQSIEVVPMIAEERQPKDSRYAPLADWLMSQPGSKDRVQLTLDEMEAIIGGSLPASAYQHRAFWANDSVGHVHSQLWLDAGWRATYVNLTEKRITFARIREREKAYIQFFSQFLADLRKVAPFPIKDVSPDGASWIIVAGVEGGIYSNYVCSFARQKRFRVELYLDTGEQTTTKEAFDALYQQRGPLEATLGIISWERIDEKRASRIALYHPGQITDSEKELAALCNWGVDTMIRFYQTIAEPAEKVVHEVTGG